MNARTLHPTSVLFGAVVIGVASYIVSGDAGSEMGTSHIDLHLTQEQKQILNHFSLVDLPDGQGGSVEAIRISGINLQIVNGLGDTATINGVGNLIVGYQEANPLGDDRTGSHNIVGGTQSSYSSYAGFVVGFRNTVSGPYASVGGGLSNIASANAASVSGGSHNVARGERSSVGGGDDNEASGLSASVGGGESNTASGFYSLVGGGFFNKASGSHSSVSGGAGRMASGDSNWVAGSLFESQ